jgi:hypothetical protein
MATAEVAISDSAKSILLFRNYVHNVLIFDSRQLLRVDLPLSERLASGKQFLRAEEGSPGRHDIAAFVSSVSRTGCRTLILLVIANVIIAS